MYNFFPFLSARASSVVSRRKLFDKTKIVIGKQIVSPPPLNVHVYFTASGQTFPKGESGDYFRAGLRYNTLIWVSLQNFR